MNDPISVFLSYYTLDKLFDAAMTSEQTRMNILIRLLSDIHAQTGSAELTAEQLTSISQIMTSMEEQQ